MKEIFYYYLMQKYLYAPIGVAVVLAMIFFIMPEITKRTMRLK